MLNGGRFDVYTQFTTFDLNEIRKPPIGRVSFCGNDQYLLRLGRNLCQNFDPLSYDCKIKVSEPRSATAGSCKALHKALLHRIGNQGEYHRNVAARLLDGTKSRCTHRNYHIWLSCK